MSKDDNVSVLEDIESIDAKFYKINDNFYLEKQKFINNKYLLANVSINNGNMLNDLN